MLGTEPGPYACKADGPTLSTIPPKSIQTSTNLHKRGIVENISPKQRTPLTQPYLNEISCVALRACG